jgi:TonB-linked SusC/RagA family outer membrane protein
MYQKLTQRLLPLLLVLAGGPVFAQTYHVTGNISDEKGEPLIGASIKIEGTTIAVIADVNGNYSINVNSGKDILEFSYVGYAPRKEPVGNRKIVNVVLQEDVGQLGEVVVVGYGTQKRESVIGAITTLSPVRLKSTTTRTISNSLAGQVPGIIAVQRSGEPGYDASNFWIRGISTFQGGRNPLVLVDGIERSLNDISAAEVESFSVLKDAAASAVYGVRGANGVILINTKRGRIGKPTVNVTVESAITQPTRLPEFVDGATYMEVINSIATESGALPLSRYSAEQIENTRLQTDPDLYPDVNWIDAITKDFATNTRVTMDVNGGTERLRYSLVAAYYGEQGIMDRDKSQEWNSSLRLNRYNVRSSVDINITPTTLLRFNVGGYLQERTGTPESINNLFDQAFAITPIVHPAQYSNGLFSRVVYRENPYVLATQRGFRRDNQSKIESLLSLEQDLKFVTPGLKVKGMFSFDNYSSNYVNRSKWPDMYNPAIGRDVNGELMMGALDTEGDDYLGYEKGSGWGNKSVYMELNASYSRTFAGKHAIDAMLMGNWRNYDDGDKQPYRNQGMAGRLSYTFDSRYIAELNFGYNGSENFAKGKRYGFFPSVAVGWLLSEEAFMEKAKAVLSKIKLRASYGLAGNSTLDGRRFAYLSQIAGTDAYEFGYNKDWYVPGLWEGLIGVPDLTWETVYKTNVGVELGLWNAIDIQFDYFTEKRRDIFMQRKNIPADAGFSESPWANFGKVDNKGFELSVTVNKQLNNDWFISVQANVTYAKNEILEQDEEAAKKGTYRSIVGRSVGQLEGLVAERLFTEEDFIDVANGILAPGVPTQSYVARLRPGDIKYKDLNADGVIDALDVTAIGGTEDPRLVYGFGVNVAYKGFDFGALFQGNGNTWRIIGRTQTFLPGGGNSAVGNIYTNVDDRWTVDNPSQDVFYPRLTLGPNENNSQASTWWLRDMSMLRMKNLEVGYSLPQSLLKKIALSNMRIYLRGTNLLTFSEFKLWDPELETGSNNGLKYPIMKSWSVGLEIGF